MADYIKKHLGQLKPTHDDDGIDRLNHAYTIYLLLGLAVTIAGKSYLGEPLQCWVPAQFKDHWESFSESYCFVENTYFTPLNRSLPEKSTREGREIAYYQWVPFILLAMALCFYLPRAIWKIFSRQSGLTLSELMVAARKAAKETSSKSNLVKGFSYRLNRESNLEYRYGSFLSKLYMLVKLLYVVNVVAQFFFLNHFLAPEYTFWGFGILTDMIRGRHWQESGHFPRVTFCDVEVRALGIVHNWTLQCVLMVNMFNEKVCLCLSQSSQIFLFLWWWLLIVLVFSCIGLIKWLLRWSQSSQISFEVNTEERIASEEFYSKVLHNDGVFVLRLLDDNCGSIMAAQVAQELYDVFSKHVSDKDL